MVAENWNFDDKKIFEKFQSRRREVVAKFLVFYYYL